MCGRIVQSSGPLQLAIVEGLNAPDTRFSGLLQTIRPPAHVPRHILGHELSAGRPVRTGRDLEPAPAGPSMKTGGRLVARQLHEMT